ncbi:MAG: hypothetical protein O2954_02315 [bacterium]|nr:hypothetical protein [bacterium]
MIHLVLKKSVFLKYIKATYRSRVRLVIVAVGLFVVTQTVCADHDLDIYSFNNVFVFDLLVKDGRIINFVSLNDTTDLSVSGHVKTRSNFGLSSYGHHATSLLVAFHDRLEVYSLSAPDRPERIQVLPLEDENSRPLFWPKIARSGDQFFIVSRKTVLALDQDSTNKKWILQWVDDPPEIERDHLMMDKFPPFNHSPLQDWPFRIGQSEAFYYEVGWKVIPGEHYRMHEKYLRKIRRNDGAIVSSLKLGELMETFGE